MQIHELNNFTGTLGSGAYLAIDDGNDTGKISSQGLLAATEARIDNIIAGPAPSAEEIVDARLGDDGVTYPSLGDAIRDQFSDVKSDLNGLWNSPSKYSPFIQGTMLNGVINTNNKYRIVSENVIHADHDIHIRIQSGRRIGVHTYNENGQFLSDSGWVTDSYVVKNGTSFRICISASASTATEDQSIEANIATFLTYVQFDYITEMVSYKKEQGNIDSNIVRSVLNDDEAVYINDIFPTDSWVLCKNMINGVIIPTAQCRVASDPILYAPFKLDLIIENGRRIAVHYFDENGTFVEDAGWQKEQYSIPAKSYFKLMISMYPAYDEGEYSQVADLITLLHYVKISRSNSGNGRYPYKSDVVLSTIYESTSTKRMQGGVVHGNYLYFAQTDNSTATIYKYDLTTGEIVTSADGSYGHAGDMTYNDKEDLLVVINGGQSQTSVWFLSPSNLGLVSSKTVASSGKRIGGIAYDKYTDRYVVEYSTNAGWDDYSFAICDSDFNVIKAFEPVKNGYLMQGIECDGQFIYALYAWLNIILIYDMSGAYRGYHKIDINSEPEFVTLLGAKDLCIGSDADYIIRKVERTYEWV